jgi:hypothetical protein
MCVLSLVATAEKKILVTPIPMGLLNSYTKHWLLSYPHSLHMCVIGAEVTTLTQNWRRSFSLDPYSRINFGRSFGTIESNRRVCPSLSILVSLLLSCFEFQEMKKFLRTKTNFLSLFYVTSHYNCMPLLHAFKLFVLEVPNCKSS